MKLKLAGIYRKRKYSPNHHTTDRAIMNAAAEGLIRLGCEIFMYDESELAETPVSQKLIFSMVQGPEGIEELKKYQDRGAMIINSPQSVIACYRYNMTCLLRQAGLPFPKSILVSTSETMNGQIEEMGSPTIWIKRTDVHSVEAGDVIPVDIAKDSVNDVLSDFRKRGLERAVLQESIDGDVVKFYSVRYTDFFYWYYNPPEGSRPEKGKEYPWNYPVNLKLLKQIADRAAETIGLCIYGGDAVVRNDGSIVLIDINDWPSFAPVREKAGKYIANTIYQRAMEYEKNRNSR